MSKKFKVPLRKCIVTKEQHDKSALIRIVKSKEDVVSVDPSGKAHGRGAYMKLDAKVIEKARKGNAIQKHFGVKVHSEIYDELKSLLSHGS